jgi:hypothetical protein
MAGIENAFKNDKDNDTAYDPKKQLPQRMAAAGSLANENILKNPIKIWPKLVLTYPSNKKSTQKKKDPPPVPAPPRRTRVHAG